MDLITYALDWVAGKPGAVVFLCAAVGYAGWWAAKNLALKSDVSEVKAAKVDLLLFRAEKDSQNARMDQLGQIVRDVSLRTHDAIEQHAKETRETLRLYDIKSGENLRVVHSRIDKAVDR